MTTTETIARLRRSRGSRDGSVVRFAYEYHELPGAHTWPFWDNSLPQLLDVLSRTLHIAESAATPRTPVR